MLNLAQCYIVEVARGYEAAKTAVLDYLESPALEL